MATSGWDEDEIPEYLLPNVHVEWGALKLVESDDMSLMIELLPQFPKIFSDKGSVRAFGHEPVRGPVLLCIAHQIVTRRGAEVFVGSGERVPDPQVAHEGLDLGLHVKHIKNHIKGEKRYGRH